MFDPVDKLPEFGCSVAVNLCLHFQKECACIFLLMLLLSIPALVDNRNRAVARSDCRGLLDNTIALNLSASELANRTSACGWTGLPIRSNLSLAYNDLLLFSLGTCQEYTNASTSLLPVDPPADGERVYEWTPNADYCHNSTPIEP